MALSNDIASKRLRVTSILTLAVLVFGIGVYALQSNQGLVHVWSNASWTLVSLLAALKSFETSNKQRERSDRRAWQFFGLGCLSWFIGMLIWDYLELQGKLTPFPEISDVAFLALVPFFVVGFFVYGGGLRTGSLTLKRLADLGVVISAMVMLCAILFFVPAPREESTLYVAVALSYPFLHLTALCFALISTWQKEYGDRIRVLTLLVVALALLSLVAAIYARTLLVREYEAGHIIDIFWVASFCLIIAAAYEEDWLVGAPQGALGATDVSGSWIDTLVPAVTLGTLLIVGLIFREQLTRDALPFFAVASLAFTIFMGLRAIAGHLHERRLLANMKLTNKELMLAQKMQALGTLSTGIAHDFNNLLTGMMTGLDMVRRRVDADEKTEAYLSMMDQSMQRAAELTRRLRSLSKRERPTMAACRPNRIVHQVAELARRGLAGGVEIVEHRRCPKLSLRGDGAMLEQSLLNLTINAQQALQSKDVGGRIDIGAEVRDGDNGKRLCFWVQDNGPGIDRAIRQRIFEPFFTTKSATEGTGLGLAMVYSVAQAHHGDVRVKSKVGQGTVIEIEVPYVEVATSTSNRPLVERELIANGETILVVDDRDEPLFAAKSVLESRGFNVIAAWSGAEALDKFRNAPDKIDLVLTDAVMPNMGGRELLAALRNDGFNGPVVLMSGHQEETDADNDFDGSLEKPFKVAELVDAIHQALVNDSRS